MFKFFAQRFAHQAEKNPLQDDGLSKITLSGANRWHVSTHQQQKSLSVPKYQAADAQTPLTGTAAPSSAPEPLQGSAPVATAAIAQHFFFFLNINWARESLSSHIKQLRFGGLLFYLSPLSFFTLALGSVKWSMQGVEIQHRYGRRWEACDLWSNNLRFVG